MTAKIAEAMAMHTFDQIVSDPRYRGSVQWTAKVGSAQVGISAMHWKPGRSGSNLGANYSALVMYRNAARIKHTVQGQERPTRKFMPGDLMLRPPGLEYATEYYDDVEVTVFALDDALVQAATTAFGADVGAVFGRLGARPFRSPLIEGLAMRLAESATAETERLYVDALSHALIHELWKVSDGVVDPREAQRGALPAHVIHQIDEAIADVSTGQVSLDALATLAGMSMTAFAAAVKATTGQTPYQYVLMRRVERARDLIETTALSLAEIAFRCGFSSQSHMTDVFKAKLGVTPGKLRASRA